MLAALWVPAWAAVVTAHADPRDLVAAWAARCAQVPALAVRARGDEPLGGPGGGQGVLEVQSTIAWSWAPGAPVCLRIDREVRAIPREMPAATPGARTANPPRTSTLWATAAGEVVDVDRSFSGRGGSFHRSTFEPTRRAAIVDAWVQSPTLLGRMVHEATGGSLQGLTLTEAGVEVLVVGVPVIIRPAGRDGVASVQFSRPNGGAITAVYGPAEPLAGVAGRAGIAVPSEVRWSVSVALAPGAGVEMGDRVRVERLHAEVVEPAAAEFVPDLAGLTTNDPATGEVRDASGTVLAVLPRRGAAWSWAWVILAGGLGVGVAAAGVTVWRGRVS